MAVQGNRKQILIKSVGTFADSISHLTLIPLSLLRYPQASLLKRWMFHCSPVTVSQSHSCHQSVDQLYLSQTAYSTLQVTKIGLKEPVKCFILPEEVLHSWLLLTADYHFPPFLQLGPEKCSSGNCCYQFLQYEVVPSEQKADSINLFSMAKPQL